ncbi:MAG: hypothetical protein JNJ57_00670 [Saprospiraceae bacterium]|nr:hypothetical protein [Saprospiraceae bacterium]
MNIYSKSKDWKERILSNFATTPFQIQIGEETFQCQSVEGFWQGLKCKSDMRLHVFGLSGMKAKKAGKGKKILSFEIAGMEIQYGSEQHQNLIREAIKQKILQNPKAAEALQSSKGKITHHVPSHSKPVFKMENLLMSVRLELYGY